MQVIQEDINFGELLCHRNASPVLQVLLLATSKVSESNHQVLYSAIVSRGKVLDIPESGCGIEDDDEFVYRYVCLLYLNVIMILFFCTSGLCNLDFVKDIQN